MILSTHRMVAAAAVVSLTIYGPADTAEQPTRGAQVTVPAATATADRGREFRRLEGSFDARLGVYGIDTGTGATVR